MGSGTWYNLNIIFDLKGLIRKPASFISTICDDRGQELSYAGMSISDTFKEDIGVGGVLSLLWFKRRLPNYASKFIEMVLMLTADHGPAVSGAHNSIIFNFSINSQPLLPQELGRT
jgi:ATP citrate (pro-S)-lyase